MIATALLFILIGIFVIANAGNFVGVFQGNKKISVFKTGGDDASSSTD